MSKFIKVENWNSWFTQSYPVIINPNVITYVEPYMCYFENDVVVCGVKAYGDKISIYLKMSLDECLEMLNGAKGEG